MKRSIPLLFRLALFLSLIHTPSFSLSFYLSFYLSIYSFIHWNFPNLFSIYSSANLFISSIFYQFNSHCYPSFWIILFLIKISSVLNISLFNPNFGKNYNIMAKHNLTRMITSIKVMFNKFDTHTSNIDKIKLYLPPK